MPVALYNQYGSPPCGLVRMVARHLDVELELRNLDMFKGEHLKPEYLTLNPYHKAPTLDDDGFILYESSAICTYLCNKFKPASSLNPSCPKSRAMVDQILATITSTIQPHYFAFFKPRFFDLKKPTPEDIAAFEENVLSSFDNHVGKDGGYAVGDMLTLADLSLAAHLTLCLELPVLRVDKFPRLKAYYERIKAELPYFDEINKPGIDLLNERLKGLK
ncbi:glutathione S-transferase 4-like [Haemaphysalis longicornis]